MKLQVEKSSEELHGCSEGNMQKAGVAEESSVSCAELAHTPTSRGQCLSRSQAKVLLLLRMNLNQCVCRSPDLHQLMEPFLHPKPFYLLLFPLRKLKHSSVSGWLTSSQ